MRMRARGVRDSIAWDLGWTTRLDGFRDTGEDAVKRVLGE